MREWLAIVLVGLSLTLFAVSTFSTAKRLERDAERDSRWMVDLADSLDAETTRLQAVFDSTLARGIRSGQIDTVRIDGSLFYLVKEAPKPRRAA